MSNWKEYKLGEIAKVKGGKRLPKGSRLTTIVNTHPYIRVRDMGSKYMPTSNLEYVPDDVFPSIKNYIVDKKDVILSIVGSVGLVSIVNDKLDKANLTENCVKILPDTKTLNKEFLYYFLSSSIGQNEIYKKIVGAVQPKLPIYNINDISINLPPLPTQTAIAEILSSLDDKIELNTKINQELENLAQTLFKQWIIDFEFPNQNGEPYKSSGGEMVDSELGEIPKGWEVGSIYDISDVIYGAPFKSKLFNQENKGLPLIRIRDLKTFQPQNWTEEIHPKGTKIYAGDLVVGMDAEFRAHFWLGQPAWLNQRLCHFRPKTTFSKLFVREIIKPQLAFHENSSVGTTVIHLGKGDIDTFKSLIPVNNILLQFEELSNSIFDTIINNSKESQELTKLRNTLLPKLISGELELNNHNF
jgi:type I restriction enzyme S subunit